MEIDKININQCFRSSDVFSILLSFAIVVVIGFLVFMKNLEQKRVVVANLDVENLANELILQPVNSSFYRADESKRGIASIDEKVSIDPWGQEYQVQVIKNSYGQPIYLVVLSLGPNSTLESEFLKSNQASQLRLENIKFEGDDVGYVKAYR